MVTISESIRINASPDDIWEYMIEPEKELRWRKPAVVALEKDDDEVKVGTRYKGKTDFMGMQDTYTTEVTELVPNRKIAWKTVETSAMMASDGYYEVVQNDDGTSTFTMSLDYKPNNMLGKLTQHIAKYPTAKTFKDFTENLKEELENS